MWIKANETDRTKTARKRNKHTHGSNDQMKQLNKWDERRKKTAKKEWKTKHTREWMKRIRKSECFFLSPFYFVWWKFFRVCFSLILELKMLNLFVAGRCVFRGSCVVFSLIADLEVYMCGYNFLRVFFLHVVGFSFFLGVCECVWILYNLPDKREKKLFKQHNAKCHWNCFYSLVVSS